MIVKKWGDVELTVDFTSCVYSICLNKFEIKNCEVGLVDNKNELIKTSSWQVLNDFENLLEISIESIFGSLILGFSPQKNFNEIEGICLRLNFKELPKVKPLSVIPLFVSSLSINHVLVHGRNMGDCSMIPVTNADEEFSSVFQCLLTSNEMSLQFTHPLRQKNHSDFSGKIENGCLTNFKATTTFGQNNLPLNADSLSIFADTDGHSLMQAYGKTEVGIRNAPVKLSPGWNSWDYYRWTITEEEVLKNAEFIKNDTVLSQHIKRITVDDGWQYCYGEWDANPLFPNGMKSLAEKLKDMGFEPGLWLAPMIIEPHARIAQSNSEMLALGESGLPCLGFECMGRNGFLLDPTRDDVREWLFNLFSRYVDYGFTFFKLDFLAQTLNAVKFHDASIGRGEIVRKILEPIREATIGKAILLGCNYTFDAGNELVDSVRVSGDIHADWNCIKENSPSIAARFWAQDLLWDSDPDFSLARGPETSNDQNLHAIKPNLISVTPELPPLNAERHLNSFANASTKEIEVLLGLTIVSGGCINLSDKLSCLNARGLDMARRTVSAERGEAAIPQDLFKSNYPGLWIQKIKKGYRVLFVNWNDEPKNIYLNLVDYGLDINIMKNFWTDEVVQIKDGCLGKLLSPHSSLFLESI